jgi:hypothetical protein
MPLTCRHIGSGLVKRSYFLHSYIGHFQQSLMSGLSVDWQNRLAAATGRGDYRARSGHARDAEQERGHQGQGARDRNENR